MNQPTLRYRIVPFRPDDMRLLEVERQWTDGEWRMTGQVRWDPEDAHGMAVAWLEYLRTNDPSAHAALVCEQATAAGMRALGIDAAETVASYLENRGRVKDWMAQRYIAALRGHATEPTAKEGSQ